MKSSKMFDVKDRRALGPRCVARPLALGAMLAAGCQPAAPPAPVAVPEAPAESASEPPPEPAAPAAEAAPAPDPSEHASGFNELFIYDECIGQYPPQPDTCLHERTHEKAFTFGGDSGGVYNVRLRVRGIFEPTTIEGGETPDPEHPYFKAGGKVSTLDWSYWHIEVSEPKQTYFLNHYPEVKHIIYKEDFEATIPVAAGAQVVVRVIDGNDRQIDNGKQGPDRQQVIEGVVDQPRAGQMLRLDVVDVRPM